LVFRKGNQSFFLETGPLQYKQFDNEFKPFLSILDVLMFNEKDKFPEILNNYKLNV
jgi:hypothetical protein